MTQIGIGNLTSGACFVKLIADGYVETRKTLKNKALPPMQGKLGFNRTWHRGVKKRSYPITKKKRLISFFLLLFCNYVHSYSYNIIYIWLYFWKSGDNCGALKKRQSINKQLFNLALFGG